MTQDRRRKREGETWHKERGPHRGYPLLLCSRCGKGFGANRYRVHRRACFGGVLRCLVCRGPFPCETPACPHREPPPYVIPEDWHDWFHFERRR